MTFKHVKLDQSVLPKNLGKKGKNQNGIRIYEVDGVNMPSVTSILGSIPEKKLVLEKWRKAVGEAMANYISLQATSRGKTTHTLIENHLNNEDEKSVGITKVGPLGLFRIVKPYLARIDEIYLLEEIMFSKEWSVAGQVDCVATYKGKLSIIDFKTSTKQRDEKYNYANFLQCSAYAKMFEELYPKKKIEQTVILAACEDGFVQEWIHGKEKIKEHQELFVKHTTDFFNQHSKQIAMPQEYK
jgi:hypothetical protein